VPATLAGRRHRRFPAPPVRRPGEQRSAGDHRSHRRTASGVGRRLPRHPPADLRSGTGRLPFTGASAAS